MNIFKNLFFNQYLTYSEKRLQEDRTNLV